MAILQHLGRKHNLILPASSKESEKCNLDMIQEQLRDIAFAVIDYTYFPDLRAKVLRTKLNGEYAKIIPPTVFS